MLDFQKKNRIKKKGFLLIKIIRIIMLCIVIISAISIKIQATETQETKAQETKKIAKNQTNTTQNAISSEEVISSQQEILNIDSFIEEADKYTKNIYEDLNIEEIFTSAISGNINNSSIITAILNAIRRGGL